MKNTAYALAALLVGCFITSDAAARTSREVIKECFAALANNDEQAIRAASDAIKNLRDLDQTLDKVDAATCVTKATGEKWSYYPDLGRVVPAAVIDWIKIMAKKEDEAVALYNALNQETVANKVYTACLELHDKSEVSAMTNQSCIETFRANGHPSLPKKGEFVRQKILTSLQEESDEVLALVSEFLPD